ncbi:hypothetical protein R1flu_016337 [Riccia fluitans]|uniref:DUF7733 domain-containing protein n=1 Tax=Riccia fluitans TaxID=41844 RepID=A0ABD1YLJ6_9MARC
MGMDERSSDDAPASNERKNPNTRSSRSVLICKHMVLVSCTLIFLAAGWVPREDILFAIFTSIYIEFMNRKIFPAVSSSLFPGMFRGRIFKVYLQSAFVLGMILPLVYVIGAFVQGDLTAVKEAVPSLFLILVQTHSEFYTYLRPKYSLMIRALVPIMYNTRRIFTIWRWTLFLFSSEAVDSAFSSEGWNRFGQVVAVIQVILWNYNLFAFLLPIFLPGMIRQYHEVEQKVLR